MAKKTVTLSPSQQLENDARSLLDYRKSIVELESKIVEIEARLKAHYSSTGDTEVAGLIAFTQRVNPPRLDGATGKRMEMLKEKLLRELPSDYVRTSNSLDIGRMEASVSSDPILRAMLNESGLKITRTTSISIKDISDHPF